MNPLDTRTTQHSPAARPRGWFALLLCLVALGALIPWSTAVGNQESEAPGSVQVILMRHAEKSSEGGSDPELTAEGDERAQSLAQLFEHSGATRFFASQFKRTQHTLGPWAEMVGAEVEVYDAGDSEALVEQLRALSAGTTVAVAAHSNTTPGLVQLLGAEPQRLTGRGWLEDDEYGRIFVVTFPVGLGEGAVVPSSALLELSY
ncbi:MAG: 2,3-bisphosphoglycerate-dependent phosphoglycerate mutase [Planctomycetota bacterium]|jgi:2,3-bisphosphoglycerate-dependent phosphoglycerate mutase